MSNALSLQINERTGDYTVTYHGFSWVSDGRRPYILLRKKEPQPGEFADGLIDYYAPDLKAAWKILQTIKKVD